MPQRAPFLNKLIKNLDRLDRESIQNYISDLAGENATFEEILQQLNEGVILVDPQGHLLFCNRQASIWLGINPKIAKKNRLQELIPDQELTGFLDSHLKKLKSKVVADVQILSPQEMSLRVFLTPLESKNHETLILLIPNDTENQSTGDDKIARIESLISLAAGIAHELGNPLNSIGIHLQLLKKDLEGLSDDKRKRLQKTLDVITNETDRLDQIIKNFLSATRKSPLRYKADDVNAILEEAVGFMKPELEKNKVKLKLRTEAKIPPFLMDRSRLYQVFMNLIKNAMEAMPKGGAISIQVSKRDNVAAIDFKDEGTGIVETDLPHIFEAYYTTKEEGSGLGLMTVYNAIREHGGRIEVASQVGKGTTFTLLLPIRLPKLQLPGGD